MKIKNKLWLMAALSVASLTVYGLTAYWSSSQSLQSNKILAEKTHALLSIGRMEIDMQEMLLNAMDIIVDKAEGEVAPERKQAIDSAYADITSHLDSMIKTAQSGVAEAERLNQLRTVREKADAAYKATVTGLYPAVETLAGDEAFAALDDAIDGNGGKVLEILASIKASITDEFGAAQKSAERQMNSTIHYNILIYFSSILAAMLLASCIIRSITRPIQSITQDIESLANGATATSIAALHRSDEIGAIAKALEVLRIQVSEAFRLKQMIDDMPLNVMTCDHTDEFRINYMNKASTDTLTKLQKHLSVDAARIKGASIDIFHKDPGRIRAMLADPSRLPHSAKITVGDEVIQLTVSAIKNARGDYLGPMLSWAVVTQNVQLANTFEQSVGSVSDQISTSANSLNSSALALQGAIEQLSASANEISQRVSDSLKTVEDATLQSDDAKSSMEQLATAANKVSGVVSLIQQIAEKTNLLALNATIESARAGDAGKGFAVVASEVKALATQTAAATNDIATQVEDMRNSSTLAVSMVQNIAEIMKSVKEFATMVAASVQQQQAATSEIARNICGIGSTDIHSNNSVIGLSLQLNAVSDELKLECSEFLEKVRAM